MALFLAQLRLSLPEDLPPQSVARVGSALSREGLLEASGRAAGEPGEEVAVELV